ncbi:GNAT family N-acetyltransferase [Nonomuraea sp. SMC257]|uniref:GNAT family N-acetyltransferase n=1 Tax=Nonomuraea montanisoli TaxID=2741721 RepID=A0A7Y6M0Z6_9ACTN|nr:GNAT family N-acetyltransferase [Nonomuraea montanisoli]NUW30542.1 GNAT family N-acetyltransferase [Nonomuraea montanisoli]
MTVVRGFAAGDEGALVDAWNRAMPADPTTPGWFRDCVLLDPNFDPEGLRVAVTDAGEVAGCAYAVRRLTPPAPGTGLEPETGWIPFLFVAPEHRGGGLGRRLLDEVLAFLAGHGRTRVEFACYTPHYVLPGADPERYPAGCALLRQAGFETFSRPVAMDHGLAAYVTPDVVRALRERRESEGYRFRRPLDGELPELIRFAAEVFTPEWGEAIRRHGNPARLLVAVRESGAREGIVGRESGAREGIVGRESGAREGIVGFAAYGAYRGIAERFGPFGVDPAERGTGIGAILLHGAMTMMRAEGLHSSWFLWTGETGPAARLYAKAGYEVTRRFHVMRRTAEPG